ncbi:MAG: hypothetical protein RBQ65_04830 [Sphaerochaeta sp.]|nr:hypothetical protein [Sphaerochaeta sp.]
MRKRIGLMCLVILITVVPVFAGVNKASVAATYALSGGKKSVAGITPETERKETAFGVKAQGTSFFSQKSNVGLSYKLGFLKPLTETVGSVKKDIDDGPLTWLFGVGAAYQIPATKTMFVELGAGADYSTNSTTSSITTTTISIFSIAAHAEINYAFNSNIFLNAGVGLSYPLGGTVKLSSGGSSVSQDYDSSMFMFAPYVGVTFAY